LSVSGSLRENHQRPNEPVLAPCPGSTSMSISKLRASGLRPVRAGAWWQGAPSARGYPVPYRPADSIPSARNRWSSITSNWISPAATRGDSSESRPPPASMLSPAPGPIPGHCPAGTSLAPSRRRAAPRASASHPGHGGRSRAGHVIPFTRTPDGQYFMAVSHLSDVGRHDGERQAGTAHHVELGVDDQQAGHVSSRHGCLRRLADGSRRRRAAPAP
jgi:hypothetical protein